MLAVAIGEITRI